MNDMPHDHFVLYGWTKRQWALAFGIMKVEFTTIRESLHCQRRYLDKYGDSPPEKPPVHNHNGDEIPCDWDSACALMEKVSIKGRMYNELR